MKQAGEEGEFYLELACLTIFKKRKAEMRRSAQIG